MIRRKLGGTAVLLDRFPSGGFAGYKLAEPLAGLAGGEMPKMNLMPQLRQGQQLVIIHGRRTAPIIWRDGVMTDNVKAAHQKQKLKFGKQKAEIDF